jgi:hypothetical protein
MSKVTDTTMGGGFLSFDKRVNRRYYKKETGVASNKRFLFRREEKANLPLYSNMAEASDAWNLLTDEEKSAWNLAGVSCGLTAFNLFIQDKCYRIMNEISGNAVPSELHQYLVGHLHLPDLGSEVMVLQVGNGSIAWLVEMILSYKSNLINVGGGGSYIRAVINCPYVESGITLTQSVIQNLDLISDWQKVEPYYENFRLYTGYFELRIESLGIKGDLYFDNLSMRSDSGIQSKDSACNEIDKSFAKPVFPDGAILESIYPKD